MEKQLLLKEAATRKKLLALKQQLQADSGMHSSNKLIAKVQNESEASSRNAVDTAAAPKTAQSEKLHITEHEGSVHDQLSMSINGNFPTRLSIKSQPSQAPPPSAITTTTANTKKVNSNISHDKSSVKEEKKSKYKQSSFGSLLLDTTTLSNSTSATDHKSELASGNKTKQAVSPPSVDKKEVVTTTETKSSSNANTSSNDTIVTTAHNPKPMTRQRLAVPDTIKETEYMSAVTKQKARVSKIRRAIQAAIVIQRAWRKYKQK